MDQPPPPPSGPDAPDKETMEQIRRRRVAKLGSTPVLSPNAETPGASGSPSAEEKGKGKEDKQSQAPTESRPQINITRAAPKPSDPSTSAQPTRTSVNAGGDMSSELSSGSVGNSRKRPAADIDLASALASALTSPPARRPTPKIESIEDYTDNMLGHIFRVTVDSSRTADTHGHKLVFLPNLSQDLQESGEPLRLTIDVLDTAIVEAASLAPTGKPIMEFLLPCWKRVTKAIKVLRSPGPEKEEVLKEARRICFSNCIFALSMPELFSREPNPEHDTLVPYLLRDIEHENGICLEFFHEALSRWDDDETIEPLFTKAMVDISNKLSGMTMNDDYRPYVYALTTYSKFPRLLDALARHPTFQMAVSAPNIEKHTLLGPFFRISPLQTKVISDYFPGPRTITRDQAGAAQNAMQITLAGHQTDLRNVTNAFIRSSQETRNKTLDWLAYILNSNHKRRAMQVRQEEVSSDAFMMNVTVILDCLCEPFMDNTFSKIDRIDVNYFRRNPRVDIKDETKLNADQHESDDFYGQKVEGSNNFITEVFFLTLAAHYYGSDTINAKIKVLTKDIDFYTKHIEKMEAERPKFLSQPMQLALFETTLKRHTVVLERAICLKLAIEGVLLEEKMQSRSLQFMRYVTVWLLRLASQSAYTPEKGLKLPLPQTQPQVFSCLPEYALQCILDNFKFVYRHIPKIILSAVGDEMAALCITFLESSEYIRNPYLKSSLVSLLYHGTWPVYHMKKGVLGDVLTNTKFANEYLLHAVMKFYIECESTGAHTQFYDKFNIRYEIFQVIKCVWTNDLYKQQLTQSSKTNRSFFVRFANMMLNDATYVLDEALTKFPKIHALEEELQKDDELSPDDRNKLSEEDKKKKKEELATLQSQARSYMQLANETVAMMKLFTGALSESFTMPEIVSRLAAMLDYNVEILAGPRSKDLKTTNNADLGFNPRALLPEIVDIYLRLGNSPAFIEAVAADGRSYKPETFTNSSRILASRNLKDQTGQDAWRALQAKFVTAKEVLDQAEADFGSDLPPEFEDPIMGDIMHDPVILPSKHVVDRSTIVQHLLSDPKDPYTRQPMTEADVVPHDELRNQIEAWKEERLRARKERTIEAVAVAIGGSDAAAPSEPAAPGPAGQGDAMDTSED